jgi:non-specific serine/threonine protein kinase
VQWLRRVLDAGDVMPSRALVRALFAYARLLQVSGVYEATLPPLRRCLELAHVVDEPEFVVSGLVSIGSALLFSGEAAEALRCHAEAVEVAKSLGPAHPTLAFATLSLGFDALIAGDPARAIDWCAQAEAICRAHGERWWRGYVVVISATAALAMGEVDRALVEARQSLRLRQELDDTSGQTGSLERLAWITAAAGDYPLAARLMGVADRQWRLQGSPMYGIPEYVRQHDEHERAARAALGDARFADEFRRGAELSLADAVAHALGEQRSRARAAAAQAEPALTRRQREVAGLVAEGWTNKQIAERLMISQRTAETYVEQILTKLSLSSRTQIATWFTRRTRDA